MSWTAGDHGWAIGTMAGGPFDGKTYSDLPVFQDGSVPSRIFLPRSADAGMPIYSTYDRQAVSSEGTWLYVFAGDIAGRPAEQLTQPTELPIGTSVSFAAQAVPGRGAAAEVIEPAARADDESRTDFTPAQRFVVAQSWWIASELCRRHPTRRVYEMHPGDGQYDLLRVWGPKPGRIEESSVLCDLNRVGTIHLSDQTRLRWSDALAASSPHDLVKQIEKTSDRVLVGQAPATTPTSLVYRVVAQLLAAGVDDRAPWDVRMEFGDSSQGSGPKGFVALFPSARRAFDSAGERLTGWDRGEQFWGVLHGENCVGVLDDAGVFHSASGALELMSVYRHGRRLRDVVTAVLDALE